MKVSIVIPVLNSHEVVRRQLLHFERIGLPEDVELILVDDGSDPPLDVPAKALSFELKLHRTNDTRPWTWAPARNTGARLAQGEYLIMTDIDHILTEDAIQTARTFGGHKVQLRREFGVLDEEGKLTQDHGALLEYGLLPKRLKDKGVSLGPLPNNFILRSDIFWEMGGYLEDRIGRRYPQGEDRLFKKAWCNWMRANNGKVDEYRPTIYMFPNGQFCGDVDHNPFGLFHDLSRKTNANYWHRRLRKGLTR